MKSVTRTGELSLGKSRSSVPLSLIFLSTPVTFQNPERVVLLGLFFVDSYGEKKYHTRSFDSIFDNGANKKENLNQTTRLISR